MTIELIKSSVAPLLPTGWESDEVTVLSFGHGGEKQVLVTRCGARNETPARRQEIAGAAEVLAAKLQSVGFKAEAAGGEIYIRP